MRALQIIILSLLLSGCVSTDTKMLTGNTAYISGIGKGVWTSSADVFQRLLVEAATTTKAAGYRYFVILSQSNESFASTSVTRVDERLVVTTDYVPGTSIQVEMYNPGQINPSARGVWDADEVLATAASQAR